MHRLADLPERLRGTKMVGWPLTGTTATGLRSSKGRQAVGFACPLVDHPHPKGLHVHHYNTSSLGAFLLLIFGVGWGGVGLGWVWWVYGWGGFVRSPRATSPHSPVAPPSSPHPPALLPHIPWSAAHAKAEVLEHSVVHVDEPNERVNEPRGTRSGVSGAVVGCG